MKLWKPNKAGLVAKPQNFSKPVGTRGLVSKTAVKTVEELEALKKSNLVKHCGRLGVEVPVGATKAELVDLILNTQEGPTG
jgi:hypothetical protein